jgi:hypothetical protein
MDEILQEVSPHHWLADFRFLLDGSARGSEEGIQIARLEDRLETRYAPHLIPHAYNSLRYSYNWLVRSWDYFCEVGLVRLSGTGFVIENSLIYALHHISADIPIELLPNLPELEPSKLVKVAQKYIDADRAAKPIE